MHVQHIVWILHTWCAPETLHKIAHCDNAITITNKIINFTFLYFHKVKLALTAYIGQIMQDGVNARLSYVLDSFTYKAVIVIFDSSLTL